MNNNLIELSDREEYKVWLVWKLTEQNQPVLVGIYTSLNRVNRCILDIKVESEYLNKPVPETFLEESKLNHFYGQSISDYNSFKYQLAVKKLRDK